MKDATANRTSPDISQDEQLRAIELIAQILKLRLLCMEQEAASLEIELDHVCYPDPTFDRCRRGTAPGGGAVVNRQAGPR